MTTQITRKIEVHADEDRVWQVLTDFDSYADWNPFMVRASGRAVPGSRLEILMRPSGGRAITIRPTVLDADAGRRLRWLGRLGVPGLFDGEHEIRIEPVAPGHVRVVNHEVFRGILVPLLRSVLARTEVSFDDMNRALKQRAEAGQQAP